MTTEKAIKTSRELADKLAKFVAATMPVVVQTQDTDNNPVITLSADATPATTEKVVVIRTKPITDSNAQTSLKGATPAPQSYGPHVIQICTEKNYESTSDTVLDILGPAELLPVFVEVGRTGCNVEWYRSANGTVPSTAEMTAANLGATWKPLYWQSQSAT